jgi:hypothetical protein
MQSAGVHLPLSLPHIGSRNLVSPKINPDGKQLREAGVMRRVHCWTQR